MPSRMTRSASRDASFSSRETCDKSINGSPVPHDQLAVRLHAIYDERPEKVLFVKGSGRLQYGEVVTAMDVARGAGVKVLGIP